MSLLRSLRPGDWTRPTWAPGWSVRDVAAHLLDGDVRRLSSGRDAWLPPPPERAPASHTELVGYLDRLNAEWLAAARRLSPRVLVDLLAITGADVAAHFATLDPDGRAVFAVGWAGDDVSPNWLDCARDYTERWHHQQQIREAVDAPGLTARRFLHPVLDISMRALPHALRRVTADAVTVEVTGAAGGVWSAVRAGGNWRLWNGAAETAAVVRMTDDTAWRLFFGVGDVTARVTSTAPSDVTAAVLGARGVMV